MCGQTSASSPPTVQYKPTRGAISPCLLFQQQIGLPIRRQTRDPVADRHGERVQPRLLTGRVEEEVHRVVGAVALDLEGRRDGRAVAAEDAARSDAIAKARARAALYAKASGLSVDRIVWIRETGSNYAPRPMIAMRAESAKASTQIEPGEQDVTVNVAVRFLLK